MRRKYAALLILIFLAGSVLIFMPVRAADEVFPFQEMTVSELLEGYAANAFTAEEVITAFFERIKTYEPYYNAFTFINAHALEEAREIDRRRAAGEPLGKLAGVPVVIKESIDVAGFPSTMGWDALSKEKGGIELIPQKDAPVVARLKEADAIILGKTNIPAFSRSDTRATSSWAGDTYNAVDRRLAPGASSSGTAAAVSGNMAVLGLAEESGGSIQNPAAAQALVGVKPTFGLVPNAGVVPLAASTRDVIGPMARTVRDAAVMLDVIAGYSPEDPKTAASVAHIPAQGYASKLSVSALKGKRIGLYGPGWRKQPLTKETYMLYKRAAEELVEQGASVVADPFAGSGFAEFAKSAGSAGFESVIYDMEDYLGRFGGDSPVTSVRELIELTGETPPMFNRYGDELPDPDAVPDLSRFEQVRTQYLDLFNRVMDQYQLDALVFPQMAKETPLLDSDEPIAATTVPEINIAGVPLITVPAGYYASGSPFSLVFVGKMWSEADLLAMAYDYEQATKYRKAPVLVKP